ncbi:hypothetical protein BDV10DRAFT_189347 [Aspergillus recurvatus]
MLIVARAAAGLGASGLMNGYLIIIPLHKPPSFIGTVTRFRQLAIVFGALLGGAFTEYTAWRWCCYVNPPIGALIAILLVFIGILEQTTKPSIKSAFDTIIHKLDPVSFVFSAPAAVQLPLALESGQDREPWGSAIVIGPFCGAGATFTSSFSGSITKGMVR